MTRQDEPDPQHKDVQYHVYDMVTADPFFKRHERLVKRFTTGNPELKYLKLAETVSIEEGLVPEYYERFKSEGYEGAILRNSNGVYVNKRSSDLIKLKEMEDAEFRITGIEEGRGKLAGHVGAFVCVTHQGNAFNVKMSGDTSRLKKYLEDHSLWEGRFLTVQFQGLTSYGIPRFPIGLRIRQSE